jgi:chromosome segregation ATPase
MAIRDRINTVISQLTGDNAEALKAELRQALTEADNMNEALIQANGEAKTRKEKLRESEAKVAELNENIEKFNNITPELARLKKVETDFLAEKKAGFDNRLTAWNDKAKVFGIDKTNKLFEKVEKIKADFIFGSDEVPLNDEQLTANERAYALLDKAGYFATDEGGGKGFDRPFTGTQPPTGTPGSSLFTNKVN